MNKIIGYFRSFLLFPFALILGTPVFAQGPGPVFCGDNNSGISTAVGCIITTPTGIIHALFTLSLGIAGGIAFLLILLGALQIQTSSGNPERINQGREIIEGAIIGLLLIIFSVFILRVVGIDILAIPGFS